MISRKILDSSIVDVSCSFWVACLGRAALVLPPIDPAGSRKTVRSLLKRLALAFRHSLPSPSPSKTARFPRRGGGRWQRAFELVLPDVSPGRLLFRGNPLMPKSPKTIQCLYTQNPCVPFTRQLGSPRPRR